MRLTHQLTSFTAAAVLATSLHAQSLCDLVPASAVKSALGLAGNLTAVPNTEGGNGCDYKLAGAIPTTVVADSSDASGVVGMVFAQSLKQLPFGAQLVSGIGDAGYYSTQGGQNIPKDLTQAYTRQSVVFRAKGKVVSFIFMTPGAGVARAAVLSLAALTAGKPLNTLKDPN